MADPIQVQTPDGQTHIFPPGATQQQIAASLKAHYAAPSATATQPGEYYPNPPIAHPSSLPMATGALGGIAGGLVGGPPGAMLGAMAGGGIGRAVDATGPADIANAALEQGAYELGGQALGPLARPVGKLLGRIPMMIAAKAGPEVAATLQNEGITATKGGVRKLIQKIGVAGDATRQLTIDAGRAGRKYDAASLGQQVLSDVDAQTSRQAIAGPDMSVSGAMTRRFMREHRSLLTPEELHDIKVTSDQIAKPIHDAIQRGDPITARQAVEYRWHKAMADRARELLNPIPGYEESNAVTQKLIAAREAIAPTSRAPGVVQRAASMAGNPFARAGAGAALGATVGNSPQQHEHNAIIGGLGAAALLAPSVQSFLSLLLPQFAAQTARQIPRTIGAASQ